MSRHPVLGFLFLLGLFLARPSPASALEWELGVAANTGARGKIRPCT